MTRYGYPNIGEAIGEATIDGNVATFVPGETKNCKITLTFLPPNKMVVTQEGSDADCGFGHNVMATGTYRRVKPGKLVVKQDGEDFTCGFGHNVNSTGTYRKVRSGKPKFENPYK